MLWLSWRLSPCAGKVLVSEFDSIGRLCHFDVHRYESNEIGNPAQNELCGKAETIVTTLRSGDAADAVGGRGGDLVRVQDGGERLDAVD